MIQIINKVIKKQGSGGSDEYSSVIENSSGNLKEIKNCIHNLSSTNTKYNNNITMLDNL